MLTYSGAVNQADWIVHSRIAPGRLITFGPDGFDAYARLRFLRDPAYVGEPEGGTEPLDISPRMQLEKLFLAVDALIPFTSTPDRGYFCVWESGVPMASPMPREHARIEIPWRDSFLIEGPLSELAQWYDDLGVNPYDHPSFIWPADRAWCIAADVDPHWAGVGGKASAIDALLAVPSLDCVTADPEEPFAPYG